MKLLSIVVASSNAISILVSMRHAFQTECMNIMWVLTYILYSMNSLRIRYQALCSLVDIGEETTYVSLPNLLSECWLFVVASISSILERHDSVGNSDVCMHLNTYLRRTDQNNPRITQQISRYQGVGI